MVYKASANATPVTYYYVLNLQGDVVKLIDATGATVAEYTYNAWGEIISATGSMAEINPLRYRGYYYDTETGFYYLQSRYYDPTVKRFINADSYATTDASDAISYNMFAYCNNNPVIFSDIGGSLPAQAVATADTALIRYTGLASEAPVKQFDCKLSSDFFSNHCSKFNAVVGFKTSVSVVCTGENITFANGAKTHIKNGLDFAKWFKRGVSAVGTIARSAGDAQGLKVIGAMNSVLNPIVWGYTAAKAIKYFHSELVNYGFVEDIPNGIYNEYFVEVKGYYVDYAATGTKKITPYVYQFLCYETLPDSTNNTTAYIGGVHCYVGG